MIDTTNKWLVGASAGMRRIIRVQNPPFELSPDDALLLAAWLVALAKDNATHAFEDVLEAVQST